MHLLLKAIRTQLTDAALNAIVPIADITTAYSAETANYPSIVLSIESGGSGSDITGVTRARLVIEIFSNENRAQLWAIYNLIKGLLHGEQQAITNSDRLIHVIYEATVRDNLYDARQAVWQFRAEYDILFSITGLLITTAADGKIYADETSVDASSDKEVATFKGRIILLASFTEEIRTEGQRFGTSIWFSKGIALITIQETTWKAASLQLLWGVTYDATDTLADGTTAATSYTVTQSTTPNYLQFLFQCTQTNNGKKLEMRTNKAVVRELEIPFSRQELTKHNLQWTCLGDSGGNVVKISTEN